MSHKNLAATGLAAERGWADLAPNWHALSVPDRKQLCQSSSRSQFVTQAEWPERGGWQPSPRAPPAFSVAHLEVEPPARLKQTQLAGSSKHITHPPSAADVQSTYLGAMCDPVPSSPRLEARLAAEQRQIRAAAAAASSLAGRTAAGAGAPGAAPVEQAHGGAGGRKMLELSSGILASDRLLQKSTLSPRQELYAVGYGSFPYGDSSLDGHTAREKAEDGGPARTPRAARAPVAKFEPPTRPGASFRRKCEKNFSDLFSPEQDPPAPPRQAPPRADANTLSCFHFQDTQTEIARRPGDHQLFREASFPATKRRPSRGATGKDEEGGADAGAGPAEDGARSPGAQPPSSLAANARRASAANGLAESRSSPSVIRFFSEASQRYSADMASQVPLGSGRTVVVAGGELQECHPRPVQGLSSPRGNAPGPGKPSPGAPPRSPRAVTCGDSRRGGELSGEIDMLDCKVAARERFQRHMSSDPTALFGTTPRGK